VRIHPRFAAVAGLAAVAILAVLDVAVEEPPVPLVLFVLAPLAVALTGAWRETAATAAGAFAIAVVTGILVNWSTGFAVLSVLGVALGGAGAVALARLRASAERSARLARRLAAAESQFTSALGALGEAVTITDGSGRMLYVNPAGVELLRAESAEALLAVGPGEVMSRFAVYDEHGAPIQLADLPGARLIAGAAAVPPMLVRNVVRATGEERWLLNKATLMPDDDGRHGDARIVNVIEDLTEIKRAELNQRLLSEASRELASSLDYETTLQRVAEVVVPDLADWCSVQIPGADGRIELVAVAHTDPERIPTARALDALHPNRADDDTDLAAIVRGERGTVAQEVPEGVIEAFAVDAEHARLLHEIGFGNLLVVPLDAGGRRVGAMVLVRSDPLRRFGADDVALAEALARRAGNAILNARLYRDHAELAATLQRGMLPPPLPDLGAWSAAALYHPAGEIAEVGGDFFDAFPAGSDWMVVIGDVTGHGPEAATLTAQARYTLRTAGQLTGDPAAAIAQLNRSLRDHGQFSLCTAACVLLAEREGEPTVAVAIAGHPLPLLLRDGSVRTVGTTGPLAGAFDQEDAWAVETVGTRTGDVLLLYTDGVADALGHRAGVGEERLTALLAAAPPTAEGVIAHLDAALAAEPQQRRPDDIAAVALQFAPGT
jgi:serine phosphatase RsbU (regulator of sigma subunit)/PAS domain-containing protein